MISKAQIKYIRSLESKKQRTADCVFVAEGEKIVGELINNSSFKGHGLFALQSWIDKHEKILHKKGKKANPVSEKELGQISFLATPNQVLGVFEMPDWNLEEKEIRSTFTLVLDRIRDPGNLGTIIRVADWFGIKNIVCSEDCVDCFNPKVVQATMGSISRLKIHYAELPKLFAKYGKMKIYGAAAGLNDVFKTTFSKAGFLLIGNESEGISASLSPFISEEVSIPKSGGAESLNAAVATSIICAVYRNQFPI